MKRIVVVAIVLILVVTGVYFAFSRQKTTKIALNDTPKMLYIAMGDSVAAGQGLPTPSDSSACDRTDESYPNPVAKTLKLELKNIACSGAALGSGIFGSQNVNKLDVTPQLAQLAAYKNVGLVTLTIGANDVDWVTSISKCYTTDCGTAAETSHLATLRSYVEVNLKKALDALTNQPKVIVTGYYQLVPTAQQACGSLTGITESEKLWLRAQVDGLNNTLQNTVAGYKFAKFAKPDFAGHELCTPEPWVQNLQDKAPFHPNIAGQDKLSSIVITTYKDGL